MGKTLILGVGNLLQSDDGVGVHVIRRLQERVKLPQDVEVVDGGTLGLNLLYYLEGVENLIVIDAVDYKETPGTLYRIVGDKVPAYLSLKVSPHQVSLPDLLLAARLRDLYPKEVVVLGVQAEITTMGLELTPSVAKQVDKLVEMIVEELNRLNVKTGVPIPLA